MNTQVFQGKNIRLTIFDAEHDAECLARWSQDSEYQQLQSSGPSSLWSVKQIKDWMEKHYAEMYSFTIRTLADDRAIGSVDLGGIDWVVGNAWIGIGIGEREYWGKGYGTDAMNVFLGFAFGSLNLKRISLTVFEYNERAIKSYIKVGFKEEGRQRQWMQRAGQRFDLVFMGILREEWDERQRVAQAEQSKPRPDEYEIEKDSNEHQAA